MMFMSRRFIKKSLVNVSGRLVKTPSSDCPSFGGYARNGKQVPWIAYDQLHTYWRASVGGKDSARAYRGYVKAGLAERHNPFQDEIRECVFGSEVFLRRTVALGEGDDPHRHQSTSRRLRTVSVKEILSVTSMEHGVEPLDHAGFRSSAAGRDMAAWLCRRWTGATLAELGPAFGLDGTDSVSHLVRRAEKRSKESAT